MYERFGKTGDGYSGIFAESEYYLDHFFGKIKFKNNFNYVQNAISQLCNKDSKKLNELMSSTKCINTATPEINKCYVNMIDSILGTAHAEDNKKIPHICW